MDIITGVVVVTAIFFPSLALAFVFVARSSSSDSTNTDAFSLANRILATLIIVYFLSLTELLLIAQQISLALGTFVVGFIALGILHVEPGLRPRKYPSSDGGENWRK